MQVSALQLRSRQAHAAPSHVGTMELCMIPPPSYSETPVGQCPLLDLGITGRPVPGEQISAVGKGRWNVPRDALECGRSPESSAERSRIARYVCT
ncbi:hypothetical protein NDU88_003449 [Pleurodeles waltl]|uniref:Uncharacterized protein n=1 Tax=Pleurodeles waltl TaxID=8319 RepID=A0AAV7TRA7_PLEWA|nr:hypothetical protein NDU88_003449 [Pleurodeles waltl]